VFGQRWQKARPADQNPNRTCQRYQLLFNHGRILGSPGERFREFVTLSRLSQSNGPSHRCFYSSSFSSSRRYYSESLRLELPATVAITHTTAVTSKPKPESNVPASPAIITTT